MRFEATFERGKKDAESTRAIHKKSIYCLDRRFLRSGLREEKDHPNKQLAKVHSLFEQMRLEARFEREEGSESTQTVHKDFIWCLNRSLLRPNLKEAMVAGGVCQSADSAHYLVGERGGELREAGWKHE